MARKKGFRLTVPCACTYSIKGQAMQFARRFAGRERALGKEAPLPAFRQGLRLRPAAVFVGIRLVFSIGLEPALPLLIFFKQQLPPVEGGSAARLVRRQIEFLADKVKNRDGSDDKEKRHNVHRAPHSAVKKLRTVSVEYHQDLAFRQMLCSASRQKPIISGVGGILPSGKEGDFFAAGVYSSRTRPKQKNEARRRITAKDPNTPVQACLLIRSKCGIFTHALHWLPAHRQRGTIPFAKGCGASYQGADL